MRKPFYFLFTKKYWFGEKVSSTKIENGYVDIENRDHIELKNLKPENFEAPSNDNDKKEKEKNILKI